MKKYIITSVAIAVYASVATYAVAVDNKTNSSVSIANEVKNESKVKFSVKQEGNKLSLDVNIADNWHLYSPTKSGASTALSVELIIEGKTHKVVLPAGKNEKVLNEEYSLYKGQQTFLLTENYKNQAYKVKISYQACASEKEGGMCLLPETLILSNKDLKKLAPKEEILKTDSLFFKAPVKLQADGKTLQTDWFGHAAPALFDLDNDGDKDLIVGQYTSGIAKIYKNIGSDQKPVYKYAQELQAGGEAATVKTFCCIGFSPCFVDFDQDGIVDILSGSYPGQLSFFKGTAKGFDKAVFIKDSTGKDLIPGLAATAYAVDIDADGDYDLVSSFKGFGVKVAYNDGSLKNPKYVKFEPLLIYGENIPCMHSGPVVFDFDGDGIKDLLVSQETSLGMGKWISKVLFYKNTATTGKPNYKKPEVLIDNHLGLRLKFFPVDYNIDGKTDLLIGDMFANCPSNDYTGFVWFYERK